MKKILLIALAFFGTLSLHAGTDAESIFTNNCVACHMKKPMMDKSKMMQMSKEDRMSMMQKMMKNMKAPPMSKVSGKLKSEFKTKEAFVAFVKDYIVNPSAEKAKCMPMAVKKFGVMPPIGKSLSETELDTIANWMYDNFNEKWDPNAAGMMCNTKAKGMGQGMKCGQGKGGGDMGMKKPKADVKSMKCAAGKCGAK